MNKLVLLCYTVSCILSGRNVLSAIYDPLNVFCGSHNCYDVLGVSKDAPVRDIKKAFRKLSLTHHPDKNKEKNATEVFRLISKAYEVLTGNDSRASFDYYLAHPRDYFKVSGEHYYRNLPKSDVRLIFLVLLGLISWFFHAIQNGKYQRALNYLRNATLNNLSLKNGGSKQTLELYRRATVEYEETIKEMRLSGDKNAGKNVKMQKDPLFEKIVDKLVKEVKIEGGYRKPDWQDLVAVQLVLLPYYIYQWAIKYHRRYISKEPLPMEDKIEMARDRVGLATWEEGLSEEEKQKLIAREIWKQEVYEAWMKEKEEEYQRSLNKEKKKLKKNRRQQHELDEDEMDYIE